jgi:hypothetical protein
MGKVRKIAGTVADPTLPKTPVVIGGKTYNLCFDLGALAEAETAINAEILRAGRTDIVNLLFALPGQNLANTRIMFAAAVRKFQPEIDFESALELLTFESIYAVATALTAAWKAANPEPEKTADPPQPGA